jgi:peptidoglycan-N-acetylglucosamine deacetylase
MFASHIFRTQRVPAGLLLSIVLRLSAIVLASLGALCTGAVLLSYLFFPRAAATLLAALSPEVTYFVETTVPLVALTIDDGPDRRDTPVILDILRAYNVRATFFLIGRRVRGNEALLARMRSEGHELANHTYDDRMSLFVPHAELASGLSITHAVLSPFGEIRWLRPGSGLFSPAILKMAREKGYQLALGDVFPLDSGLSNPRFQRWYLLRHTQPGSIIILHDAEGRGIRTAATLHEVLPVLQSRGFKLVTLTELAALCLPPSARGPSS